MFLATNINIYGHQIFDFLGVKRKLCVGRIDVTEEIPGRIDERIHGVSLTNTRLATTAEIETEVTNIRKNLLGIMESL